MGNFFFCEVYCSPLLLNVLFHPLKSNNFENGRRNGMDGQKSRIERPHETFFMTSHRKPILNLEKCESFICGRKTFLYEKST